MPEYPDVELYRHALTARVAGEELTGVRLRSPSLLKSVQPRPAAAVGRRVTGIERIGKRIVFAFEGDLFFVLHLMIAGRLQWKAPGAAVPRKRCHGALDFPGGTLLITEASTKKRASLHVVEGRAALAEHDPGGVEVFEIDQAAFEAALTARNRTLKRALTDPRTFSAIGNAYSDEILHAARLSPVQRTGNLGPAECERLFHAVRDVLTTWRDRVIEQSGTAWPKKVTAFRPEMAVHGKYKEPCPDCGDPVRRIVYVERELNYCATCQTEGRLLKDRALSRLLKDDWPAKA